MMALIPWHCGTQSAGSAFNQAAPSHPSCVSEHSRAQAPERVNNAHGRAAALERFEHTTGGVWECGMRTDLR